MEEPWVIWVVVGGVLGILALWASLDSANKQVAALRARVSLEKDLAAERTALDRQELAFQKVQQRWQDKHTRDLAEVRHLATEKSVGFPWLADAYGEYFALELRREADLLATKRHPAPKAAEAVRALAVRVKQAEREARVHRYVVAYYESLFPWLPELRDPTIDDLLIARDEAGGRVGLPKDRDPIEGWLSAGEFKSLSTAERADLALKRYAGRKKSNWEIGRDFERYVGYQMELAGFQVSYHGIAEGFEDLGRDLVARVGAAVSIVQCKYWSREKQIHEKHVFQLYGTMIAYRVDHPTLEVSGELVTSTKLSPRARQFAQMLGIDFREDVRLERYPLIKCNVSRRSGERIYHLPFDQQYDMTVVEPSRDEFFASSAAEAEAHGYRRAFRWQGS